MFYFIFEVNILRTAVSKVGEELKLTYQPRRFSVVSRLDAASVSVSIPSSANLPLLQPPPAQLVYLAHTHTAWRAMAGDDATTHADGTSGSWHIPFRQLTHTILC